MVKKNQAGKALDNTEKEIFRHILLVKRAEIVGDVGSMENDSLYSDRDSVSHSPLHMADLGSDNYERENVLGLLESEIRLLIEVEQALKRLDDGVFGICEGNGEFIPKARLEAIPWARYCVSCASHMEKFDRRDNSTTTRYHFASGIDDMDIDNYSNRNILYSEDD